MDLTIHSTVILNNGVEMPLFGFGTWQLPEGPVARQAVSHALSIGYRLIDTAAGYDNERSVGQGMADSGLSRDEVFITTKLWNDDQGYDSTLRAFEASLERLGMEYVDLYLIHWPATERWPDSWRAMLTLLEDGRCRAIGVSNFEISHLERLKASSPIMPAVNQVPFHLNRQQRELIPYCREHEIAVEGYSPLRGSDMDAPVLKEIAARHSKTAAQVLLRWSLQHGVITIPKSSHEDRIRENAGIFGFALDASEMAALDALGA